jgi:hypothetical protein
MGPKLVLVIAMLGAASLSWPASAERGACRLPNLTREGAKKRGSSLKPEEVEKILDKIDANRGIAADKNRIDQLLELKEKSPCSLRSQQHLKDACYAAEKESLKGQCLSRVSECKNYCRKNPVLVVEQNFNSYLDENMEALIEVSDEAKKQGEGPGKSIEKWVTELGVVGQARFYEICRRFLEDTQCAWDQFAIRVRTIEMEPPQSKYFSYADKHCETIVGVIKKARMEKRLTLEDAEEMLKSQSLGRVAVAEILARLDKNQEIDGVRVGELFYPDQNICNVENQVRRVSNCGIIETQSLKNYCEDLVERVKTYCSKYYESVLPKYSQIGGDNLKGIALKLDSVATEARNEGKKTQNFFNRWVVKQRSGFVDSVERECEAFYEHERTLKELLGLDLMKIPDLDRSDYYYLRYASSYCMYALNAIENKRRNNSLLCRLRGLC